MKSTKISTEPSSEPGQLSRSIELFRYNIASCEMRFIEHSERVVSLVREHEESWAIQGCIPGCGTECDADLTMILLEYLMSCEGSMDAQRSRPELCLSEKVGRSLIFHLRNFHPELSDDELVGIAIDCIVRSLGKSVQSHQVADRISLCFSKCPVCVKASECGMRRGAAQAHDLLVDMCRVVVAQLLPEAEMEVTSSHRDEEIGLEFSIELYMS